MPGSEPTAIDITISVQTALKEDLGSGDLTALLVPTGPATAILTAREAGVLCGVAWFNETFRQLDTRVHVLWSRADGDRLVAGESLCRITGPARVLLTGERTAINFLQTLSGTATAARAYADRVAHTKARVLDTRKTLPGLRGAQKYAVRCGGCHNHRLGLYDGVLIKENHITAAGSIAAVLHQAHAVAGGKMIEIEVENLRQLQAALAAHAPRILLDNFSLVALREAVKLAHGHAQLEASGGLTLDNIADYAETGVDFLSVGDMTKNVRALDLSLRLDSP
ncbi:MAG: carboxylating nicotinate-nucleotide diphosphorylase [Acidiferrobacter sp.]